MTINHEEEPKSKIKDEKDNNMESRDRRRCGRKKIEDINKKRERKRTKGDGMRGRAEIIMWSDSMSEGGPD